MISSGMQGQLVCSGCRTVLLYPRGAASVCCAICSTITTVPPPGMEMAQLICGGCRTLLMHVHGATTVRCSCCNTINITRPVNQVANVSCAHCHTTLMYPYGAPSVKCAICHYVTNVGQMDGMRLPVSTMHRINGPTPAPPSASASQVQNTTVVVENPMSVDESGKLLLGRAATHDQLCDAMHESLLNTETESKTGRPISDLSLQAKGRSLSTPSSAKF
ncbi:unnamed protein product [Musa textilis]